MNAQQKGTRDPLTGAEDYDEFGGAFDAERGRAQEHGTSVSLGLVDVDRFAQINSDHGHETGDCVLQNVAAHLAEAGDGAGRVFRCGGDEFLVLLPATEREEAFLFFEKLRSSFDSKRVFDIKGKRVTVEVGLSIGVASCPEDGSRGDDVVRRAEEALHRAKTGGRNKVCLSRQEKMVTKTSHYTQRQLERLAQLAKQEGVGEAALLREALDDLLRRYDVIRDS